MSDPRLIPSDLNLAHERGRRWERILIALSLLAIAALVGACASFWL